MAERNEVPETLTFEEAAPETLTFEEAAPPTLSFEDAGGASGFTPPVTAAPGPASTRPVPGAPSLEAMLDFVSRPGTPLGGLRSYATTSMRDIGEGQEAAVQSLGERASRLGQPSAGIGDEFQKLMDVPGAGLDALAFLTRPIFAPVERGISNLTGGIVSPEDAGVALMGVGPRGVRPTPRGATPPVRPPAPIVEPGAPSPVVAEPPPAPIAPPRPPGEPAQRTVPRDVSGDLAWYSPAANKGEIAVLDKKISRAEEALREIETTPGADPSVSEHLRGKLNQWRQEREALGGLGTEMEGATVAVTPAKTKKGRTKKAPIVAETAPPKTISFEDASKPTPVAPLPAQPGVAAPGVTGGGTVPPGGSSPPGSPTPPGGRPLPAGSPLVERPLPPSLTQVARLGAKKIEQILSPTTVDETAQLGEALIRKERGQALRETEKAAHALSEFNGVVRRMDETAQLDFIDYMETRSAPTGPRSSIPRELQPLADAQRAMFQKIQTEMEALPATEKMRFIEDYFPHLWADRQAVDDFLRVRGISKEGSKGFTKKREIPTVAEGLAAGLKLHSTNPIDAAMQYATNAYRFIAQGKVHAKLKEWGMVKSYIPGKQPEGWTELSGRFGGKLTPAGQMRSYAPDGLARIYNNSISRDVTGPEGDLVHGLQRASNWVTGVELGMSGFHFATMGQEAIANGFANAYLNAMRGKPIAATKQAAKAITNPVSYAMTGGRVQRAYLDKGAHRGPVEKLGDTLGRALGPSDAHVKEIADLLAQVGGRAVHIDNAYLSSRLGDYVSSWKKGTLKTELAADYRDVKGRPVVGTASVVSRHIARMMDTISKPLFQQYIPKLKVGAFADNMGQWMLRNPNATPGDKLTAARRIWDSVDNRFGEMVRDNIFWRNAHKQAAQIALRSYTWTYGFLREFGGGLTDAAKLPYTASRKLGRTIQGKTSPTPAEEINTSMGGGMRQRDLGEITDLLGTKSRHDPQVTQRMAYALGLPTAYVLMNAIIQYLYTGKTIENVDDALAARTGGVDYSTGKPERVVAPGFMKDVFGWYNKGILGETYAKMATLPRFGVELLRNEDWRGMPVYPMGGEQEGAPSWAQAIFEHAADTFGPFGVKQVARGRERGSNINEFMTLMGFQPTGMALTDPERYKRGKERHNRKEWRRKERADVREQQRYQGPQE